MNLKEHNFGLVPSLKGQIPRSVFDRRFNYKSVVDSGYLNPWYVDEVLPGDTLSVSYLSFFGRMLSALKVPVMDDIILNWWLFYCPTRVLWDNFKKQQGERRNPNDSIDYLIPVVSSPSGGWPVGSIVDLMGPRPGVTAQYNALPLRMYNLTFNEWFRNENLVDSLPEHYDDGPDPASDYKLVRRMKRADYFTSCLPSTQKGSPVVLPWDGYANVELAGNQSLINVMLSDSTTGTAGYLRQNVITGTNFGAIQCNAGASQSGNVFFNTGWNNVGLRGRLDLSQIPAIPITSLRDAFQVQRILERDMRGGTRYTEILRSHWGVVAPDASLQRPELIALGQHYINIQQVAQTSQNTSDTYVGELGAYGIFSGVDKGFAKSFTEHGYILGLLEIRTPLSYQQGTPALWWRRDRYDMYMPELMYMSEQPVYRREINTTGTASDNEAFGYQEPWASYRYSINLITGKLRSGVDGSLDVWHFAQYFENPPVLSKAFIEDNPPIKRVLQVQDEPEFLIDIKGMFRWTRQMPVYGIPGLVDHV